jgi:[histone H3]-lysine36 N-dimethyltransferase SETMAR
MQLHENPIPVYYHWKRGLSPSDCKVKMDNALSTGAPHLATICRWYTEFKRGKTTFEDDPRSGRPSTAVTDENINAVRALVGENRHVTYQEIETILGIGSAAVRNILHERLGYRKVCSRWVPHRLTEKHMEAREMRSWTLNHGTENHEH